MPSEDSVFRHHTYWDGCIKSSGSDAGRQNILRFGPPNRCIIMFQPSREAGLQRFHDFLPRAGSDYAATRNYDQPYGDNVSRLSPWIRVRLLTEWELVAAALKRHGARNAGKFVDEVCWRTYWKGWLALRPSIWDDYIEELKLAQRSAKKNPVYRDLIVSRTGIECMDVWTQELIETGYLHNHARMWYASIWVHTLKVPWVLGAAFFLRHLLDGDAASNTLSWRWVAGLHTAGKTYLAQASNIEKYTRGRFKVKTPLAQSPTIVDAFRENPKVQPLVETKVPPSAGKLGLLVHEDDLSSVRWIQQEYPIESIAGFLPSKAYHQSGISDKVIDFRERCLRSTLPDSTRIHRSAETLADWARSEKLDAVMMAEPSVGIWNSVLPEVEAALNQHGIRTYKPRHWWDSHLYPHARAGFFRFKKAVPAVLEKLYKDPICT